MMKEEKKFKAKNNLYLLSFIDVMDRLDILMLEIRHLQQTIIYSLKAPSLYLPLRYEEAYLFGDGWDQKISIKLGAISDDIKLAKEWVIRYPTPKSAISYYCKNDNNDKNPQEDDTPRAIKNTIKYRIGKIWMGDNWVSDQRRQYHSLYALQILKQHVLCDKIALAKGAIKADILTPHKASNFKKPAFLILRAGVFKKVNEYVLILRNQKHQVSQSIEFGMPSDPHPSTERRRDMGIFMDFIFKRTIDIQRDILHLYKSFNEEDKKEEDKKEEDSLLMFHGWSQNTAVSTLQLDDEINSTHNLFGSDNKKIEEHPIGYVSTSFWTPDRPDLHPMIAFSVAESVIRNTLNRLDDVALSNNYDDFTSLIARMKLVLSQSVTSIPAMAYFKKDVNDLLRKIAADLLAASVKGVAYLYSLFLAIIGDGLASQLYVAKKVKLEMVYALEQGTATYDDAIIWYLRLNLTASWLKKVLKNISVLDQGIITGVEDITKELLNFLTDHTPLNRERVAPYWISLLPLLINEIEVSTTARRTWEWRDKRAKDGEKSNEDDSYQENKRCYSRSTRGLNVRLQNYLFRELLRQKQVSLKNKITLESSDEIESLFTDTYFLPIENIDIADENGGSLRHPKSLFNHIYDIPYQASIIRSIDILRHDSYTDLFHQLQWDMELGRGLFGLALEFHTRESESPKQRLSLCINQVAYLYFEIKTEDTDNYLKDLARELKIWLNGEGQDIDLSHEHLDELQQEFCKDSRPLGANKLAEESAKIRIEDEKIIRQLETIAGYKLRDLFEILKDKNIYNGNKAIQKSLSALVQFLSLRKCKDEDEIFKKSLFYNRMLNALGDISEENKRAYENTTQQSKYDDKYIPTLGIRSIMLHRLSMTNYYPVSDPVYLDSPNSNGNGFYLAGNLKRQYWTTQFGDNDTQHSETWITLGRFDAVSMIEVKLPCKCYIHGFDKNLTLPHKNKGKGNNPYINESFTPYFSRREIARPVDIISKKCDTDEQMFAIISVTLQRRSMRLDFLYRLIRALKKDYLPDFQSGIDIAINVLATSNIHVEGFLTDGWGDIVFKFNKETTGDAALCEQDIEDIFKFQTAIYEDFMVDRTEIVFAPQCIDHTLAHSDKYRISMEARMMEDRWLESGIQKYTDRLQKALETPFDFLDSVKITMMPGRNDFNFQFIAKDNEYFARHEKRYPNKSIQGAYQEIIERLNKGEEKGAVRMLSHVETYIGKVSLASRK